MWNPVGVRCSIALALTGTASKTTDYTIDSESLTLTAGETSVTTKVTGVDDTVDDEAEIVLSSPTLGIAEGDDATYTVKLATEPTATVTVAIMGHAGTDLTPDKDSLEFTTTNWNEAQTVTVSADQDDDADNDSATLLHTASGGDYAGEAESLEVTTTDNDDEPVIVLSTPKVKVDIHVNVKHTVGGISTLDRKKFMTIHSSHTDREWTDDYRGEGNFTEDLLTDFLVGNDVYFGRDTGYISWHLRNNVGEDPARQGWARVSGSNDSISQQGLMARNTYHEQVELHRWEERADNIMAPQYTTFWPDGTPTNKGWALSQSDTDEEPLGSATGAFVGEFLNHFHANETQVGRPLPKWVEVMNEPDWPLLDNGDTPARVVWEFHNTVANEIRQRNDEALIGGYSTTFPDPEENNFREWQEEWKLFIDLCGASTHLYFNQPWGTDQPSLFEVGAGKIIEQVLRFVFEGFRQPTGDVPNGNHSQNAIVFHHWDMAVALCSHVGHGFIHRQVGWKRIHLPGHHFRNRGGGWGKTFHYHSSEHIAFSKYSHDFAPIENQHGSDLKPVHFFNRIENRGLGTNGEDLGKLFFGQKSGNGHLHIKGLKHMEVNNLSSKGFQKKVVKSFQCDKKTVKG